MTFDNLLLTVDDKCRGLDASDGFVHVYCCLALK